NSLQAPSCALTSCCCIATFLHFFANRHSLRPFSLSIIAAMQLRNGTVVGQTTLQPQFRPLFEEGVRLVFSKWTALTLAVQNQWGGANSAEKAEVLFRDCLDWFYKKREHYADELEEELDDAILQDFNVEAEDGSPRLVAEALVKLYGELLAGGGSSAYLQELRSMAAAEVQQCKRQVVDLDGTVVAEEDADMDTSDEDDDDEDDEDDDMDADGAGGQQAPRAVPLEPPAPRVPVVDEDGFTMVQGKGRRGKR
ncbi:hypothetical protein Agub_g2118, partial [Astrephomene gubernaculifera]